MGTAGPGAGSRLPHSNSAFCSRKAFSNWQVGPFATATFALQMIWRTNSLAMNQQYRLKSILPKVW